MEGLTCDFLSRWWQQAVSSPPLHLLAVILIHSKHSVGARWPTFFLFPLQRSTIFNLVCTSGFGLHSQTSTVCLVLQCTSMTLFARALKSSCVCAWEMSQLVRDIWVSVLLVFASATLGDSPSGSTPTVCYSGPIVVCRLACVRAAAVICPSVRVAARGRTPCFAELAL